MKKFWIYFAGIITGFIATVLVSLIIANPSNDGVTMFPEVGNCINVNQFEVFQVLDSGAALANGRELKTESDFILSNNDIVVLLVNDEGKYYYDDELIDVSDERCVKQIGIYKYSTKMGTHKTVPIVKIFDNN